MGFVQRSSIAAVGELTNCLPGTEAKLITKAEVKNYCLAEFRPPNMKLGYAVPMIVSTSCPNCTKPFVSGSI